MSLSTVCQYRIEVLDKTLHLFGVELNINQSVNNQVVKLPRWIPGSYMIRDFSQHIHQLRIEDQSGKNY